MMTDTARARSRLFQLVALGFAHPVPEFHRLLLEGSYRQALATAGTGAGTCAHVIPAHRQTFDDFEGSYIRLFQIGRRGRPQVSLNAGDHRALNGETSRPEFLLRYADWYRHFGLRVDDDPQANELPDHLVCQLEFMAWLGHLESDADVDRGLAQGYRRAQRDFLERHLLPFLELLVAELQQTGDEGDFFLSLAALALESGSSLVDQLNDQAGTDACSNASDSDKQVAAVNLWG